MLDEKTSRIRKTSNGTVIEIDGNNGVCTKDMSICLNETGPVVSWQGQWVVKPLPTNLKGGQHCVELKNLKTDNWKRLKEKDLNGVEEGEDGMSDEEGDGIDGEEELAPPDWRVRAGPRNRPTQKKREEHEARHVPSRGWCTYCRMGRGRTHHHVTEQKRENQSRRPTIAMDHYLMKLKFFVNAQ